MRYIINDMLFRHRPFLIRESGTDAIQRGNVIIRVMVTRAMAKRRINRTSARNARAFERVSGSVGGVPFPVNWCLRGNFGSS